VVRVAGIYKILLLKLQLNIIVETKDILNAVYAVVNNCMVWFEMVSIEIYKLYFKTRVLSWFGFVSDINNSCLCLHILIDGHKFFWFIN